VLNVMKSAGTLASLFSLLAAASACAEDSPGVSYLSELGPKLQHARSLPVGAKTTFLCPADLDQSNDIPMKVVVSALAAPDYEAVNQHSYFLTSPIPADQRGGGFPELTFFSSSTGRVERPTCFYSK
jgi:hypothetical protein